MDPFTRRLTGIGLAITFVATVYAVNGDWTKAIVSATGAVLCLLWGFWGFWRRSMRRPIDSETGKPARIPHPDRKKAIPIILNPGYSAFCLKTLVQREPGDLCYIHPKVLAERSGYGQRVDMSWKARWKRWRSRASKA